SCTISVPIPKITPRLEKASTLISLESKRSDPDLHDDILEHFAALQRAPAEMARQDAAEQPPRGAQALLVVERLAPERKQRPSRIHVLAVDPILDRLRPVLEVVQIPSVGTERLTGLDLVLELETVAERPQKAELEEPKRARHARRGQIRKAVTIAGKNRLVRVAARDETQYELVRVVGREKRFAGQRGGRPVRLDVGQRAELAAARPREPERHERLQQRAAAAAVPAAPARDEPDTAVVGRHALDELARV